MHACPVCWLLHPPTHPHTHTPPGLQAPYAAPRRTRAPPLASGPRRRGHPRWRDALRAGPPPPWPARKTSPRGVAFHSGGHLRGGSGLAETSPLRPPWLRPRSVSQRLAASPHPSPTRPVTKPIPRRFLTSCPGRQEHSPTMHAHCLPCVPCASIPNACPVSPAALYCLLLPNHTAPHTCRVLLISALPSTALSLPRHGQQHSPWPFCSQPAYRLALLCLQLRGYLSC